MLAKILKTKKIFMIHKYLVFYCLLVVLCEDHDRATENMQDEITEIAGCLAAVHCVPTTPTMGLLVLVLWRLLLRDLFIILVDGHILVDLLGHVKLTKFIERYSSISIHVNFFQESLFVRKLPRIS